MSAQIGEYTYRTADDVGVPDIGEVFWYPPEVINGHKFNGSFYYPLPGIEYLNPSLLEKIGSLWGNCLELDTPVEWSGMANVSLGFWLCIESFRSLIENSEDSPNKRLLDGSTFLESTIADIQFLMSLANFHKRRAYEKQN